MEEIYAPNSRISEAHSSYFYSVTIIKLKVSVGIIFVAMLRKPLLSAIIKNTVSENADILCILGIDAAVNQRVAVNIDAFSVMKRDLADKVDARAEIVCNLIGAGRRDRF